MHSCGWAGADYRHCYTASMLGGLATTFVRPKHPPEACISCAEVVYHWLNCQHTVLQVVSINTIDSSTSKQSSGCGLHQTTSVPQDKEACPFAYMHIPIVRMDHLDQSIRLVLCIAIPSLCTSPRRLQHIASSWIPKRQQKGLKGQTSMDRGDAAQPVDIKNRSGGELNYLIMAGQEFRL
jgi:hypothetical protein